MLELNEWVASNVAGRLCVSQSPDHQALLGSGERVGRGRGSEAGGEMARICTWCLCSPESVTSGGHAGFPMFGLCLLFSVFGMFALARKRYRTNKTLADASVLLGNFRVKL